MLAGYVVQIGCCCVVKVVWVHVECYGYGYRRASGGSVCLAGTSYAFSTFSHLSATKRYRCKSTLLKYTCRGNARELMVYLRTDAQAAEEALRGGTAVARATQHAAGNIFL